MAAYGYCPQCGAPGVDRERRRNGNDYCANGHTYPSSTAIAKLFPGNRMTLKETIRKFEDSTGLILKAKHGTPDVSSACRQVCFILLSPLQIPIMEIVFHRRDVTVDAGWMCGGVGHIFSYEQVNTILGIDED
jgi:hypothetical protein